MDAGREGERGNAVGSATSTDPPCNILKTELSDEEKRGAGKQVYMLTYIHRHIHARTHISYRYPHSYKYTSFKTEIQGFLLDSVFVKEKYRKIMKR